MKKLIAIGFLFLVSLSAPIGFAKGDDFGDVVKLVERFYHVKHKGIPFLARAGLKTATTVARLSGGRRRQIAEAGSVKVAYFEDQDFTAKGSFAQFKATMNSALMNTWSPLTQVASSQSAEQTHVYLREAGDKFQVLVLTIAPRDACIVQVTLSPQTLAQLMRSPDNMGETITVDATTNDED